MKRSALAVACVAGMTLAAEAPAQGPAEPGPTAEHARLGYFVGTWRSEVDVKASPFSPGGTMTIQDDCQWFEGKFAVICRGEGTGPGGALRSLGLIGYNADENVYTYYGLDNKGMVPTTVAKGTIAGDTWTFTDEAKMGGATIRSRYVIRQVSENSYTFLWEMQGEDGAWKPVMEGRTSRGR